MTMDDATKRLHEAMSQVAHAASTLRDGMALRDAEDSGGVEHVADADDVAALDHALAAWRAAGQNVLICLSKTPPGSPDA